MRKLELFGAFILFFFGFISCSPTYYPSQANIPLVQEKGMGSINGALNASAINLSGNYAFTDKFVLAAGFNAFSAGSYTSLDEGGSSGSQFEVLSGYYKPYSNNKVFEILGGYGIGYVNSEQIDGVVQRFIIQPSVGYVNKRTEGAFTLRIVDVSTGLDFSDLHSGFIEPIGTWRIGRGRLKFTTQMGFSIPLYNSVSNSDKGIESRVLIFNLGLQYRFTKKSM